MAVAIVLAVVGSWFLVLFFVLALCRSAAVADRMMPHPEGRLTGLDETSDEARVA